MRSAPGRWPKRERSRSWPRGALTLKIREDGRGINAVDLVAAGDNGDGHRKVLGVTVTTSETKEAWNVFFADLVARGLTGFRPVTSDAHRGLVEATAANLGVPPSKASCCATRSTSGPSSSCAGWCTRSSRRTPRTAFAQACRNGRARRDGSVEFGTRSCNPWSREARSVSVAAEWYRAR